MGYRLRWITEELEICDVRKNFGGGMVARGDRDLANQTVPQSPSDHAIGHAHLARVLARLALSGAACQLVPAALAQPALAVDAARGERDPGDFTREILLQCQCNLSVRRG